MENDDQIKNKVGLNPTNTMIIYSISFLQQSNAATIRREMSIRYFRVAIIILLHCISIVFCSLFHATSRMQVFQIFPFIVSAIIL